MYLAGDVGGTKVNLALCEVRGSAITAHALRRYPSAQFESLSEVVLKYLAETGAKGRDFEGACFGVPGPVIDGRCTTVNLPWTLDAVELARKLSRSIQAKGVQLINDLEATAYGVSTLSEGHGLSVLRPSAKGWSRQANMALVAPGTGLGEATMIWDGGRHIVAPSEGGHADFGPQDEEQIELLRWLWPRHKHVSWEHVASGPAIHRLYRFFKETRREAEPPELAAELARPGVDPSPVIAAAALSGKHRIAERTLDLWLFCLGAEAGNLALKVLARGGIFIGGGIVPNVLELFRRPAFFDGLNSKGRMTAVVEPMPVFGVTDPLAALYGAAIAAAGVARSKGAGET